jgi:hypothetical protein
MSKLILLIALFLAAPAVAEESGTANPAFKSIITHQLQAFAADDAPLAYSDAAPNVHTIFPTPDVFMNMVRGGYAPVYRNKAYDFEGSGTDANGRPYQRVGIIGADGARYEAIYFMEQEPDGSWKISGCVVAKAAGEDA